MFRRCTLLRKAFAGYETFFIAFLVPHLKLSKIHYVRSKTHEKTVIILAALGKNGNSLTLAANE